MRVQGQIKNQKVVILVDTDSTHNFVGPAIVKKGGYTVHSIASLPVTVANGEKLHAREICSGLQVVIQRETIISDFFVLPLRGCDMVLRVQWLVTVGSILWDFFHLTMQFTMENRCICWSSMQAGQLVMMTRK